ncbi:hypothetical protein Q7P37_009579 [Cladosporium fusiforme]
MASSRTATLVLSQKRPAGGFARRITLTEHSPVASVGRSSRSEAKNLSATAENALFDCPVISRKHAEFELSFTKWVPEGYQITITDMKSMHGTSVNGIKLRENMPFHLRPGDTIRLGDHISRADSTYDGITVVLETIMTSSTETHRKTKGISVPSDSESDAFDDDVEDDEEAMPVPAHTTIPDTYEVSQGAINPLHREILQEQAESMLERGDDVIEDEDDSWSNQDQFSDDGELSMEDDEDDSSVVDPSESELEYVLGQEDDDEGPEVMSSRQREPSQEIDTTLGSHATVAPTIRSHYDPVRRFLDNSPIKPRSYDSTHFTPAYPELANPDYSSSSKWDVGPSGLVAVNDSVIPKSFPSSVPSYPTFMPASCSWPDPTQHSFNGFPAPATTMAEPVSASEWALDDTTADTGATDLFVAEESRVPKRKASEISTNSIEAATDPQVQPTVDADATLVTVTPTVETQSLPKKRKIKHPRTKKSFLKTAATEAGKYAAGAFVGSVGLVAFLASPIGARLAEC